MYHQPFRSVIALLMLGALWSGAVAQADAATSRPNIVILLADDLGYRDLGCYGGPVRTPHLDALAAAGMRFEQFYAGCAVCSPSRATLLTGRHHIRTGVYSWIHDASQRSHLLEREVTIAELLKVHGYATAHIGKWHLGLPSDKHRKPTPTDHGFDHWFATGNNAEPSHRQPRNFIRNGMPVGELPGYSCDIVVDEAIAWLERSRPTDRPFLLNVWFHEPHSPIAAPDEVVRAYGALDDQAAIYSATIANTDQAIGRLMARLATLAPVNDTVIIYASDNGSYRRDRVGDLRASKGSNWEGGLRVPGIITWPGVIPAGRTSATPAGVVDVLPTICGLLAVAPPQVHLDGSDLSPLLRPSERSFTRHQPLFWHLQKSRPIVALRDGRWSLTANPAYELSTNNLFRETWIPLIRSGGYTNWQLFDLERDPGQQHNLAAEQPEELARLKAVLEHINTSVMQDATDWNVAK